MTCMSCGRADGIDLEGAWLLTGKHGLEADREGLRGKRQQRTNHGRAQGRKRAEAPADSVSAGVWRLSRQSGGEAAAGHRYLAPNGRQCAGRWPSWQLVA